jgi:hypothetical protein
MARHTALRRQDHRADPYVDVAQVAMTALIVAEIGGFGVILAGFVAGQFF